MAIRLRIICHILLMAFCSLAAAPAAAASEAKQAPAVMFAGGMEAVGGLTRIHFDVDRKVDVDMFHMGRPARIVLDTEPLLFRFADPAAIGTQGPVASVRYGLVARDRSRVVLTLGAPARAAKVEVEEIDPGKIWRLSVLLEPVDEDAFASLVAADRDRIGRSGAVVTKGDNPRAARPERARPLVVIDPGHGGIDGGAKGGNGLQEKDLTLSVGFLVRDAIRAAGSFDVEMTRSEDVFISLSERVNFARRHKADLVISLHADSLRQNSVRGASVYVLSRKASDELAHELAQSENMSDIVAGFEAPPEDDAVNDILADLTARETATFSRSFSSTLVEKLKEEIALLKNPMRSASFAVLKAPEVPGVLIEMGYLSNAEDEKQLTDPDWQKTFAGLVARAVSKYFETHRK